MHTRLNNCNQVEQLMTYLYGEASPQEAKAFETHLEACAHCREDLAAFGDLRRSLETWEVELSPRVNVTVERSPLDVLRELISLTPAWLRFAGAAAASAAIVLVALALAGTHISWREGTVSFAAPLRGQSEDTQIKLTRAEIETMIADRVRVAKSEGEAGARVDAGKAIEQMNAQIGMLSDKLVEANRTQERLATSLVAVRREQRAMIARGQSTLGEWLFASSNGARDQWGENDERNN
jgi:Putative zinc-finger